MMALVVSRIVALGVKVIHIPGGCTGLCQPLDVSVNQSFKSHVCRMWEEWLTSLLEESNEVRDATRKEVSEWMVVVSWEMVGKRILQNCWRKMGFDWFPGLVDQEDVIADTTTMILEIVTMVGMKATAMLTMICCLVVMRRGRRVTVAMRRRVTVAMTEFFCF
jgi:hypothetical protein